MISILKRIIYFSAVIAMAACSQNQTEVIRLDHPDADRSFLNGEPCEPPCWYGLELDVSTQESALDTLISLPFIIEDSINVVAYNWFGENGNLIFFDCTYETVGDCGDITVTNGLVRQVSLSVAFPLTFEDAVSMLGEPDHMQYGALPGGKINCRFGLSWVERGIYVDHVVIGSYSPCDIFDNGGQIPANAQIHGVLYTIEKGFFLNGPECCYPFPGIELTVFKTPDS